MKDLVDKSQRSVPILLPYEPEQLLDQIRKIVRDEILAAQKANSNSAMFETPGMDFKPLYKIVEVCSMFNITKPTVYDWIQHGKLKPIKIRSRVFFLWQDIQDLIQHSSGV